ncbi:hypothetical protein V6N12_014609 [Hibiscus sabdariffa]|uniref:Non-haem dioxygenase N-terminal domain-containing protein n=1 Tax=Hibiscus sabdariffa TaxID=183260 RepID=A0ABR2DKP1_9ROSI
MMSWPEQVVRVQSLSESGIRAIPNQYIKPLTERPVLELGSQSDRRVDIPVIDLHNLFGNDPILHLDTLIRISTACRHWGFFQAVNHGVSHELMRRARQVWRDFFNLPLQVKQEYANAPTTYEGYGSRLGVEKGAILDWSDYFFLHYLPVSLRNQSKWPEQPSSCREVVAEYGCEVAKLCTTLLKAMSTDLGLKEKYIENAFGGDNMEASLRVMSNAIYTSVEHRVIANSAKDGVSLAMFFNPKSDLVIKPAEELVSEERPAVYDGMTFDQYRVHMRMKGPCGKARLESLKFNSPK